MPTTKGKKPRFTAKDDRQASHVAASMKKRGKSAKDAKAIGYATVTKQKSARKKTSRKKTPVKKGAKFSAAATARNREGKPDKAPMRRKRNKGRS